MMMVHCTGLMYIQLNVNVMYKQFISVYNVYFYQLTVNVMYKLFISVWFV